MPILAAKERGRADAAPRVRPRFSPPSRPVTASLHQAPLGSGLHQRGDRTLCARDPGAWMRGDQRWPQLLFQPCQGWHDAHGDHARPASRRVVDPRFKWVNIGLGNIKGSITGTCRAIRARHARDISPPLSIVITGASILSACFALAEIAIKTKPKSYKMLLAETSG